MDYFNPDRFDFNEEDKRLLADLAQNRLRVRVPVDTGYGRDHTFVDAEGGSLLSIRMPRYLWALNNGYKPFLMTHLAGKTVPIRLPGGTVIFRKATEENIGKRRITDRDPTTGQILPGNRPISWRHPGVKPRRFVEAMFKEMKPIAAKMYVRRLMKELDEVSRND